MSVSRVRILIFLAAGIGGMAPGLFNLAKIMLSLSPNPTLPGFIYLVGLLIFFGLGGLVAVIFGETDFRKAFFLGISLPALLASAQSGGTIPASTTQTSILQFMSPSLAYAEGIQSTEDTSSDSDNQLTIISMTSCANCTLWFFNDERQVVGSQPFPDDNGGVHSFAIPEGASRFGIWNSSINPHLWIFEREADLAHNYSFDTRYNRWNDLRRGLGAYDLRSYDSIVTPLGDPT